MPYIRRIVVNELRHLSGIDIGLPTDNAQGFSHLILTGPNGSGKTTLLRALADRCAENTFVGKADGPSKFAGRVERGEAAPETLAERLKIDKFAALWAPSVDQTIAAYASKSAIGTYQPATRKLGVRQPSGPQAFDVSSAVMPAFVDATQFLLQYLVNQKTQAAFARDEGDTAEADRIGQWFDDFESKLTRLIGKPDYKLVFDRKNFTFRLRDSENREYGFDELADGHSAVIALLTELILRVEASREAVGDKTHEPPGVVFIDEVETHLHLELQEQILPLLTSFFPRLQFIVTTHSPVIIASLRDAVVYDLESREAKKSDDLKGIRYGTLMQSHFDISSDYDLETTERFERLKELVKLAERNQQQDQELQTLTAQLSEAGSEMALAVWELLEYPKLLAEKKKALEEESKA